ncbi:hypothetical protein RSAG8_12320, partial [Rhizoctonia solani AG-8 WAC10335]
MKVVGHGDVHDTRPPACAPRACLVPASCLPRSMMQYGWRMRVKQARALDGGRLWDNCDMVCITTELVAGSQQLEFGVEINLRTGN